MSIIMRALLFSLLIFVSPVWAQEEPQPEAPAQLEAPYDVYLLRLAEILGSVHYLRTLCGTDEGTKWREAMEELLFLEEPQPARRARLTAHFNRGYRGLNETYSACTSSARLAGDRYTEEGEKLTTQILSRFGR